MSVKKIKTTYSRDKVRAIEKWEKMYFTKLMTYYSGKSILFISKAIKMDRRNLIRKLKSLKIGPYETKVDS